MPLVPDPKNCDVSVKRAIQGLSNKLGYTGHVTHASLILNHTGIGDQLTLSKVCTIAAGLNVLRVTGLQTDDTALTGTLRGAYIDVSNGSTAATGTIRAMELKARTEAPGDTGNDVAVLEGLSISADSKAHSVTTMRAAEFILDGKTAGTIDEAVGLRIANNLQVDKATVSYGLQIYRDSFDYTADIQLSDGSVINKGGKWGIGTSTPDRKLTISGSGTQNIGVTSSDESCGVIFNAATGYDCRFIYKINSVNYWFFGCDGSDNGKFKIGTSALGTGDRFTIQSDGNIGIGTSTPDSIFHIKANVAGTVGSHPAGQLIIQDPDDTVFGNAVITGYESDGAGNPDQQLWYLGSSSSSNSNIIFLNRRNSKLQLGTNGVSQLTISGSGNFGIGESSPETLTEWTGTAPYLTLHNSTHEDTDGGGESKLIFKREDGAGTETACFQFEASHDGAVANDQLGKGIWSVNTGAGLVQALEIGSDLLATFAGAIVSTNYTAANLLAACASNAGELDFTAASKKLDVEDNAVVSQDYSSDASPQFTGIELGHATDTTITRASAGNLNIEGNLIYRAGGTDVPIGDGGTGQSTAQLAINALSAVSGATNEHVLTKDTGTGNAIWKVAAGAGFSSNCRVGLTNNQVIAHNTVTKLNLDDEDFDGDGEWDSVNHKFVVTTTGKYLLATNVAIGVISSGITVAGYIFVNNVEVSTNFRVQTAVDDGNSGIVYWNDVLELTAEDEVDLRCYHNSGANRNALAFDPNKYMWFAIHRLS